MLRACIKITLLLLVASLLEAVGSMDFLAARLETLIHAFVSNPGSMILFLVTSLVCALRIVGFCEKRRESCRYVGDTQHNRRDQQQRVMEDK